MHVCHVATYYSSHYWKKSDTTEYEMWKAAEILETKNGLVIAKDKSLLGS